MDVKIEQREESIMYGLRHVGPYMDVGPVFGNLWSWVCANGLEAQVEQAICVYHDNPFEVDASQLRSDACVLLKQPHPPETDTVKRCVFPAGRYVCYRHVGSYAKLEEVYGKLCEWLPSSGYLMVAGPSFEIYHNDPSSTPEERLITDIYIQIAG